MDLIKVRQQTQQTLETANNNSLRMLRQLAAKEGLPGLYAGLTAPLLAVVPAFAVTFYSFDTVTSWQLRNHDTTHITGSKVDLLSISQVAFGGAVSGVPLALTVGPLERFKCLMQVSKVHDSFLGCVRAVYSAEGLKGVFRGTSATILRDVPGNAAYFASYEFLKRQFMALEGNNSGKPSILSTLMAGGLAGMTNWTVAIPFDVLKSKWQTAAPGTYRHVGCVLQHVLATQGPTALFQGLGPALLRAFPANAACLLGVETARSFLR